MPTGGESIVALEHLDSHVKAILKLKLRAFVHLNPCFDSIHSIDTGSSPTNTLHSAQVNPPVRPARRVAGTVGGSPTAGGAKGAAQRNPERFERNAAPTRPEFPPIPQREPLSMDAEVKEFAPNLPVAHELNVQPGDCPNRLAVARLRRRVRL